MAKLAAKAVLSNGPGHGTFTVKTPYDKRLVDWMHLFQPGPRWDKAKKVWVVPEELYSHMIRRLEELGFSVKEECSAYAPRHKALLSDELYPFQRSAVNLTIRTGCRALFFEMGLGKTATAINTMKVVAAQYILIVCPAAVREVWKEELDKWWPEHPSVHLIVKGTDATKIPLQPQIVVCSYELAHHLGQHNKDNDTFMAERDRWDFLVVDEAHYIKNMNSRRTKVLQEFSEQNANAVKLLLTGTPIGQHPKDLWAQLNWVCPMRWGTYWEFVRHYAEVTANQYSKFVIGEPRNQEELNSKLRLVASRATREEVADQLPKVTTSIRRFDDDKAKALLELLEEVPDRVLVFTFLRKTATILAKRVHDRPTAVVTGEHSHKERARIIENIIAQPGGVLFATMDSCGTGLNSLVVFHNCVFAETAPKILTMVQAAGRVVRLSSNAPVMFTYLVQRGSKDEMSATNIGTTLVDIGKVVKAGGAEDTLKNLFLQEDMSDDDVLRLALEAAGSLIGEDDDD